MYEQQYRVPDFTIEDTRLRAPEGLENDMPRRPSNGYPPLRDSEYRLIQVRSRPQSPEPEFAYSIGCSGARDDYMGVLQLTKQSDGTGYGGRDHQRIKQEPPDQIAVDHINMEN